VPNDHIILPEVISKEPLGPLSRHGDNNWNDIIRWTYFAMLNAEELGVDLPQLPFAELQKFSPLVGEDVFAVLTVEGSLAQRNHIGGTAPEQVRAAVVRARSRL